MSHPSAQPARIPVIVGIGEITDRSRDPMQALEPLALMAQALAAAEQDAGAPLLRDIGSLDVVSEYSWPYADAPALLCERLGIAPARRYYGVAGGESPVRFMHEAALRIARGECVAAAVVGAEANHAVNAAARAGVTPPWTPKDPEAKLLRGESFLPELALRHGMVRPIQIYPLYENASQAAWGQTPREALAESGELWSRYAKVAQANPASWSAAGYEPDDITTPGPDNRLVCWPYTKRMVANPMVNMGAAVLLTSLDHALSLGIPESRLVFLLGGAAANEPRDYLQRDQYVRSHAQDAVLERSLALAGGSAEAFSMLELYSCFPVVPKMARRTLGLPATAQMTSTGGLSFFGAPLNNYMTHAAAGLVRGLRQRPGERALLYGQGEYVTKHHALILASRRPLPGETLSPDYSVQDDADARRGPVPDMIMDFEGVATLETYTIVFGRYGAPEYGTAIGRTASGHRLMARVRADDAATLRMLMDPDASPVGSAGSVAAGADGLLTWTLAR